MSEDRDEEQTDPEQAEVARQEAAQQAKEDEQAVREETGSLAKEGDRMEERTCSTSRDQRITRTMRATMSASAA